MFDITLLFLAEATVKCKGHFRAFFFFVRPGNNYHYSYLFSMIIDRVPHGCPSG